MKKIQEFSNYNDLYNKVERYINEFRNDISKELDKFNLILQLVNSIKQEVNIIQNPGESPEIPEDFTTPVFSVKGYIGTALGGTLVGNVFTLNTNGALGEIDGITYTTSDVGQVVFLNNQTNPVHNGIYQITSVGNTSSPAIFTRISYYDEGSEVSPSIISISEGDSAGTFFEQTTDNPIVNTSPLIYVTREFEENEINFLGGSVIYVDPIDINSTDDLAFRTSNNINKYNRYYPFKTLAVANSQAVLGDTILLLPGRHIAQNINNNGVTYILQDCTLSSAFTGLDPSGDKAVFRFNLNTYTPGKSDRQQRVILRGGKIYSKGLASTNGATSQAAIVVNNMSVSLIGDNPETCWFTSGSCTSGDLNFDSVWCRDFNRNNQFIFGGGQIITGVAGNMRWNNSWAANFHSIIINGNCYFRMLNCYIAKNTLSKLVTGLTDTGQFFVVQGGSWPRLAFNNCTLIAGNGVCPTIFDLTNNINAASGSARKQFSLLDCRLINTNGQLNTSSCVAFGQSITLGASPNTNWNMVGKNNTASSPISGGTITNALAGDFIEVDANFLVAI